MTPGGLAELAERAVKWSAATTVARFVLQLAAQVALARILGPDNFGVYGMGLAVLTLVSFLAGASFSWNLMLMHKLDDADIRFAFTWQLVAGIACALAMAAAAPAVAEFFGDARVEGMVRLLSLACVLTAASAPAVCLLQRDLDFRTIGLVQLGSYAAGYLAVGVPMALHGYGAAALGTAAVVQAAVVLVASYAARPHPLSPLFFHAAGADTLATGRVVFVTNMVNWLLGNVDRVLIGRLLNAQAVGLYNVAYNLACVPSTLLLGALQPTILATGARLQQDVHRLAQGWRIAIASVLVLVTPAAVVAALLASDIVQVLYGHAWAESGLILGLLFLCLPAWAAWGVSTPILWNTGRKQLESVLQIPVLAFALPAWWFAAPFGLRAVAAASAAVIFARAAVIVAAALRALGLRWMVLAGPLGRGLGLSAVSAAVVLGAKLLVSGMALPLVDLLLGSAGALALMLVVLAVRPQLFGDEARAVLARAVPFARLRARAALAARAQGLPL